MAVRAFPECYVLRLDHPRGELDRVLEVEVRLRLPLLERLQRLAQEFAVLQAGQSQGGCFPGARARRTEDPAQGRKQRRFTAMSPRFEEHMKGARGRTPAPFLGIKSPAPALRRHLIGSQSAPLTDRLRACAVRHHADGELIASKVPAQPVVGDMDFHMPALPGRRPPFLRSSTGFTGDFPRNSPR